MDEIEILVASVPDREEVVAEIWLGGAMFAEIRSEGATLLIEVYNHRKPSPWGLEFVTLLDILMEAKRRLRPDATVRAPGGGEPPQPDWP